MSDMRSGKLKITKQVLREQCKRLMFCKAEPLSKRGAAMTARPVQGVSDVANILLGPWMRKFTHTLKKQMWHKDWNLTYSCGMTADEVG
jgi:hypothetical protein